VVAVAACSASQHNRKKIQKKELREKALKTIWSGGMRLVQRAAGSVFPTTLTTKVVPKIVVHKTKWVPCHSADHPILIRELLSGAGRRLRIRILRTSSSCRMSAAETRVILAVISCARYVERWPLLRIPLDTRAPVGPAGCPPHPRGRHHHSCIWLKPPYELQVSARPPDLIWHCQTRPVSYGRSASFVVQHKPLGRHSGTRKWRKTEEVMC